MPANFSKTSYAVWALSATLIASATGCGANIAPSELPGTWTISRSSQHLFPADFDVSSATLILKSDGTFTATGLPQELVLLNARGTDAIARINGSGRWALLERNGFSGSRGFMLEFRAIQGPGTYKLPYSTMIFSVSKTGGIAKIFYFHDDPDLGRRVDFDKQQ